MGRAECCAALCHPASLWCWGNAAAYGSLPFLLQGTELALSVNPSLIYLNTSP